MKATAHELRHAVCIVVPGYSDAAGEHGGMIEVEHVVTPATAATLAQDISRAIQVLSDRQLRAQVHTICAEFAVDDRARTRLLNLITGLQPMRFKTGSSDHTATKPLNHSGQKDSTP